MDLGKGDAKGSPWRVIHWLIIVAGLMLLSDGPLNTFSAWRISDAQGVSSLATGTWDSFSLSTPSPTAGTSFSETITAKLSSGTTDTAFTGTKTILFAGPSSSPEGNLPTYPSSVTFSSGVGIATITLYDAQSTTLTASDSPIAGTSSSFTVSPGPADQLCLMMTSPSQSSCNATLTIGTATTFTGDAGIGDAYGNLRTDSSTVGIDLSDSNFIFFNVPSGSAPWTIAAGNTTSTWTYNGGTHSSAPNTGTVTASSASGYPSLASGTLTVKN
jgi:hypothetical protein